MTDPLVNVDLTGGELFIGPLASPDRHACRCQKGVNRCAARPTGEDGYCDGCRSGCSLRPGHPGATHMRPVGRIASGTLTLKGEPATSGPGPTVTSDREQDAGP